MLMTALRALGHRFSAQHFLSLWRDAGHASLDRLVMRRRPRVSALQERRRDAGFDCIQFFKLDPHGLPNLIRLVHGVRRRGRFLRGHFLSGRKLALFLERSQARSKARLTRSQSGRIHATGSLSGRPRGGRRRSYIAPPIRRSN